MNKQTEMEKIYTQWLDDPKLRAYLSSRRPLPQGGKMESKDTGEIIYNEAETAQSSSSLERPRGHRALQKSARLVL